MNTLTAYPRFVEGVEVHEGISFSSCVFIEIRVDDTPLTEGAGFGGAVFLPELSRSVSGSGDYLIFTCYCGIADDSGWTPIRVEHKGENVLWSFDRSGKYEFQFMRESYAKEILRCQEKIVLSKYPLAISSAVWPE